jgi:UDP-glucuronate 4-epimerase
MISELKLPSRCVLLTGCAGFIGARTTEMLLDQGLEVIGVDNLNNYYDPKLKNWRLQKLQKFPKFKFYAVDIEDASALKTIFQKHTFDIVYNLAARAGVRASIERPDIYFSTNLQGALHILNLMRDFHVPKYVLASTSSLYAGQPMPFAETLPVNTPISPYAASKKSAEMLAYTYHHLYKIDVSIVRYFTVYGPAGRPDMATYRFVHWIDRGEEIQLFGDGAQSRDFTYVDDIARGTILAGKHLGHEVINLGGGNQPHKMTDLIAILENYIQKTARIKTHPFHEADLKVTYADIQKAKRLLGWEPKVDLVSGLKKSWEWYQETKKENFTIELSL